jgi:hypothetical protein
MFHVLNQETSLDEEHNEQVLQERVLVMSYLKSSIGRGVPPRQKALCSSGNNIRMRCTVKALKHEIQQDTSRTNIDTDSDGMGFVI